MILKKNLLTDHLIDAKLNYKLKSTSFTDKTIYFNFVPTNLVKKLDLSLNKRVFYVKKISESVPVGLIFKGAITQLSFFYNNFSVDFDDLELELAKSVYTNSFSVKLLTDPVPSLGGADIPLPFLIYIPIEVNSNNIYTDFKEAQEAAKFTYCPLCQEFKAGGAAKSTIDLENLLIVEDKDLENLEATIDDIKKVQSIYNNTINESTRGINYYKNLKSEYDESPVVGFSSSSGDSASLDSKWKDIEKDFSDGPNVIKGATDQLHRAGDSWQNPVYKDGKMVIDQDNPDDNFDRLDEYSEKMTSSQTMTNNNIVKADFPGLTPLLAANIKNGFN